MNTIQIAELLEPFLVAGPLAPEQLDALSRYLELLLRWNARTNLTAVRDERNIVIRHFGESLFLAAKLLGPEKMCSGSRGLEDGLGRDKRGQRTLSVIDVGSGAGFPGLPIKIYGPQIALTLIESQNKKATFLKEVIRSLHLQNASVYSGRAENYEDRADLVTLRAVEQFERVLPIAAGLVKSSEHADSQGCPESKGGSREATLESGASGRLALLIGAAQLSVARKVLPEFSWEESVRIPETSERVLLVGQRNFGRI